MCSLTHKEQASNAKARIDEADRQIGANSQVEVYDPSPDEARALVLGGMVKPIGYLGRTCLSAAGLP